MRRKTTRGRCWKRKETRMMMMSMGGVRRKLRSRSMMIPIVLNLRFVFNVGAVIGQDVCLIVRKGVGGHGQELG